MKKLKTVAQIGNHQIKSSVPMSAKRLTILEELLQEIASGASKTSNNCKRMHCCSDWLLARMGISIRVIILFKSQPKQVWVIQRQELDRASRAIKSHSKFKGA